MGREMRPEPVAAPLTGSIMLHIALFGGIGLYAFFNGFHHDWGSPGPGSAIQVSLDSAAIPLPNDQPKTDNVLPTDKPSPAPLPPEPKARAQAVDPTAIPILGKQVKQAKKQTPPMQKTRQQPKPESRVQYGEQAGQKLSRSTFSQASPSDQPASVDNGDFGSRFGWYVEGINRKMSLAWDKREVDPGTPRGTRVYLVFSIVRDGTPREARIDRSSGSVTLDRSCLHGVQRVDTFGQLPAGYNSNTLKVGYFCEY